MNLQSTAADALVPLLCIGLFALAVGAILIASNRQSKARKAHLERLGFAPLSMPDPALTERVERLYQHASNQRLEIKNAYRRSLSAGVMYVFDLIDSGGQETSTLGSGLLGLCSKRLNLPMFTLLPWAGGPADGAASGPAGAGLTAGLSAMAGAAAQSVLDFTMRRGGLQKISVPYAGEFNRAYSVFGSDESAVLNLLTPERANALLALGTRYELVAAGDFFTLKMGVIPGQRQTITFATHPDLLMTGAAQIVAIFDMKG